MGIPRAARNARTPAIGTASARRLNASSTVAASRLGTTPPCSVRSSPGGMFGHGTIPCEIARWTAARDFSAFLSAAEAVGLQADSGELLRGGRVRQPPLVGAPDLAAYALDQAEHLRAHLEIPPESFSTRRDDHM